MKIRAMDAVKRRAISLFQPQRRLMQNTPILPAPKSSFGSMHAVGLNGRDQAPLQQDTGSVGGYLDSSSDL